MKHLSTLLAIFLYSALSAQETFQRLVLSDHGIIHSMGHDATGNRYTATMIFADSANAFYGTQAVKYGPDGNVVWHLRLGNPTGTGLNCNDMAVSDDGEVVMINDQIGSSPFTSNSAGVTKLDANGELAWARSFQPDGTGIQRASGQCVTLAANGDILAGGVRTFYDGGGRNEIFVARLSASGSVLWTKSIGIPAVNNVNRIGGIGEDAAGAILVFGQTAFGTADSWLQKLSSTGEPLWCRKYSTTTVSSVLPLALAADGAGYALFYVPGGPGPTDHLYRANTDANGVAGSAMSYGAQGQTGRVYGVTPLPNGNFAMAGFVKPIDEVENDATLFTTDGAGAVQWAMHYGGRGAEGLDAVEPGPDGGFLTCGLGQPDSISQVASYLPVIGYLVKTDANGHSFGCEGPLTITSTLMNFSDEADSLSVTDVTGWANAAVTTSMGYVEVSACPSIGIRDVKLPTLGLYLYPNPASDQLTLTSGTALRSIEVHAGDGRLMSRQRMAGTPTLDIRALAPGAYVLRALDAQGHVLRGRFVKE